MLERGSAAGEPRGSRKGFGAEIGSIPSVGCAGQNRRKIPPFVQDAHYLNLGGTRNPVENRVRGDKCRSQSGPQLLPKPSRQRISADSVSDPLDLP